MPKVPDSPNTVPVIEKNTGLPRLQWILWFQKVLRGDTGTAFAPVATGLTSTGGAPTMTGAYYQNQGFTEFWIKITPASGGDTSAVTGTTYFDLPFNVGIDSGFDTIVSITGIARGVVQASTKRAYPFAWTAVTSPVILSNMRVLSQ